MPNARRRDLLGVEPGDPRGPRRGERPGGPGDGDRCAGAVRRVDRGLGDRDRRARTEARRRSRSGSPISVSPMPSGEDVRRVVWAGDRAANRRDSTAAVIEALLARDPDAAVAERAARRSIAGGRRRGLPDRVVDDRLRPTHPETGLDPARAARPIRAGERIHVVGRPGPGASARRPPARCGGRPVRRLRRRRPVAVHGGARGRGDPGRLAARPGPCPTLARRRTGSAVTKALTAIAPTTRSWSRPARPASRSSRGSRSIADAAVGRTLVAVAGTHGKSTTAGWLVHVLTAAGADPSAFVGALLRPALTGGPPATARRGRGAAFVVEADEYAGNFDAYRPAVAVVTNVEWDHPDVFADRAAVVDAFARGSRTRAADADRRRSSPTSPTRAPRRWSRRLARLAGPGGRDRARGRATPRVGGLRAGHRRRVRDRDRPGRTVFVGRIVAARLRTGRRSRSTGSARPRAPRHGAPATAGRHNAANALGVAAAALGARRAAPTAIVDAAVASFPGRRPAPGAQGRGGRRRRLRRLRPPPTAIRETLAAVRQREPGRRVWAVYEPLTFHRTAALLDGFADALAEADAVAIADIWAGRDLTRRSPRRLGSPRAVAARTAAILVAAPGLGRGDRRLARRARSGRATRCSSWAAGGATGSASCSSRRSSDR